MAKRKFKEGDRVRVPEIFVGEIIGYDASSRKYLVKMIYMFYNGLYFKVPHENDEPLLFSANYLSTAAILQDFVTDPSPELIRESIKGLWIQASNDSIVGRAYSLDFCPYRSTINGPVLYSAMITMDKGVYYLRTGRGQEEYRNIEPFEFIEPEDKENKQDLLTFHSRLPFVYAFNSSLTTEDAYTSKLAWFEEYGKFAVNGTVI